jgi:hypothetical protein
MIVWFVVPFIMCVQERSCKHLLAMFTGFIQSTCSCLPSSATGKRLVQAHALRAWHLTLC